jgi:transposase-like protein
LKNNLDSKLIQNRWIGILRIKKSLFNKLKKINSPLINNLEKQWQFYKYPESLRKQIYNLILDKINSQNSYICMDEID